MFTMTYTMTYFQRVSFDKEGWVFEKVLSSKTRGPVQRSTVSPHRRITFPVRLSSEALFLQKGPRLFHGKCNSFSILSCAS